MSLIKFGSLTLFSFIVAMTAFVWSAAPCFALQGYNVPGGELPQLKDMSHSPITVTLQQHLEPALTPVSNEQLARNVSGRDHMVCYALLQDSGSFTRTCVDFILTYSPNLVANNNFSGQVIPYARLPSGNFVDTNTYK